jgi:hypothetical protein
VWAREAFEPGNGFAFPEGEAPQPIPNGFDTLRCDAQPSTSHILVRVWIIAL